MALTVATNTGALMAQAAASSVNKDMEIAMERLSTGKRINGASDDAAGVAIASRLTAEIRGTNQAIRNAMDGQALIDTAEGAHQEIESILQRVRELAVQAANDTNSSDDRDNIQTEVDELLKEVDRISAVTTWAGVALLEGDGTKDSSTSLDFQIGSGDLSSETLSVTIGAVDSASIGLSGSAALTNIGSVTLTTSGNQPVIGNSGSYSPGVDASGSYAVDASAGTITFSGDSTAGFNDTATITLELDGTDYTYTYAIANVGSGENAVAADFRDWLADETDSSSPSYETAGVPAVAGLSATVSTNTVTVLQTPTATVDADNGTITLTDGFADTDTLSMTVDGTTVSITVADDGYANSAKGVAEQFADKIRDTAALSSVNISVTNEVITLTKGGGVDVTSASSAVSALSAIDDAITELNNQRAQLGSYSNRLDNTVSNLTNISSNLQAGRGRIEDADFAAETTSLAKAQILQQASTAMLAQANASKQNVLSLLQG